MGKLILIPTPLQDHLPLEEVAKQLLLKDALNENVIILVEEHKVARNRWLSWGLPREAIEKFIVFNEHTQEKMQNEIVAQLKAGKDAYLLSDCGLPAFCDPGQKLVDACHRHKIKVTSSPFPNSISLAIALSGFSHKTFIFSGFVPVKEPERNDWMKKEIKRCETLIWMETPYRLNKLLTELKGLGISREMFLACDLNGGNEFIARGSADFLLNSVKDQKKEFVLVLSST